MDPDLARTLWHHVETINAVTYFCPECRDAPANLGLKGFWMGYFACRAAPMGAVGPGVVEATFFNFHPDRVRRALPDAWQYATPDELVGVRAAAAARALRRIAGHTVVETAAKNALPPLREVVVGAATEGRPLFAANRDLPLPDDPVEALWQSCTTFREHRGDGHVALLTAAGLSGCQAHLLFAAEAGVEAELYQRSRGWSADDWRTAIGELAEHGLVDREGTVTESGRQFRAQLERRTDELSARSLETLGTRGVERLMDDLRPVSHLVATSGELMFPNPMGLPHLHQP